MSKKISYFFVFLFALALLFSHVNFAHAQELTFQRAYDDYLFKLDAYRKSYTQFEKARDFYLQSRTLALKEDARVATYEMLVARDDLMAVYLTAIRTKLHEIPEHPGAQKGDILSDIPGEVTWFNSHKDSYNKENDTLETLFAKSDEVKERYAPTTLYIVYETLSRIGYSKFLDFKIQHENIYAPLKQKVQSLEGPKRIVYDRWINDIDKEFQLVTDTEATVHDILADYRTREKYSSAYDVHFAAISTLGDAKDSLLRINGFLLEMLNALNKDGL